MKKKNKLFQTKENCVEFRCNFNAIPSLRGNKSLKAFCEQKFGPESVIGVHSGRRVRFRTEALADEAVARLNGEIVDEHKLTVCRWYGNFNELPGNKEGLIEDSDNSSTTHSSSEENEHEGNGVSPKGGEAQRRKRGKTNKGKENKEKEKKYKKDNWVEFKLDFNKVPSLLGTKRLWAFCEQKLGAGSVWRVRDARRVNFRTAELADEAVTRLHGKIVDGHKISVYRCPWWGIDRAEPETPKRWVTIDSPVASFPFEKIASLQGKKLLKTFCVQKLGADSVERVCGRRVRFRTEELADEAVARLNGEIVDGHKLTVCRWYGNFNELSGNKEGLSEDSDNSSTKHSPSDEDEHEGNGVSPEVEETQRPKRQQNKKKKAKRDKGHWAIFQFNFRAVPSLRSNKLLKAFCEQKFGSECVVAVRGGRHVRFRTEALADEAVALLNGEIVDGHKITVSRWFGTNFNNLMSKHSTYECY